MRLSPPFHALDQQIAIDLGPARALFTTRRGGVSRGPYSSLNLGLWTDDDPDAVRANRARVASRAGVAPDRLAQGRQVHGADVRRIAGAHELAAVGSPADGQATGVAGVAPIVLVADCLPVVVAGEGAVAALHCGWRGLAAGIVEAGVRSLHALGGRDPLSAAIGPGAGPCCYEAGQEVHAAFPQAPSAAHRDGHLDLKLIAADALRRAGVVEVHDVGLCTICSDPQLFFSHRRDHGRTGRQAGIAWLS